METKEQVNIVKPLLVNILSSDNTINFYIGGLQNK